MCTTRKIDKPIDEVLCRNKRTVRHQCGLKQVAASYTAQVHHRQFFTGVDGKEITAVQIGSALN